MAETIDNGVAAGAASFLRPTSCHHRRIEWIAKRGALRLADTSQVCAKFKRIPALVKGLTKPLQGNAWRPGTLLRRIVFAARRKTRATSLPAAWLWRIETKQRILRRVRHLPLVLRVTPRDRFPRRRSASRCQ